MLKLALTLATCALFASSAAASQTPTSRSPERKPLICKEQIRTGSHMRSRKVCKTAEEWGMLTREIQGAVDEFGRKGSYGSYDENGKWRGDGQKR